MGTRARYCIGADENGLGPRLGPMSVTAVLARVTGDGDKLIGRKPRGGLRQRLGDSKQLVAHGNYALAEAWARVLVARGAGRHRRTSCVDELIDAVALDSREVLTEPCPTHVKPQCWNTAGEALSDAAPMADIMKLLGRDLDRLAKRGLEIVAVRSAIVCTKRLNDGVARGESRFVMDLHAMERLILTLRDIAGEEVDAVCGKVGGFGQYGKAFGPLGGRLHAVVEEGRARSCYRFPGVGDIAFVRDSDASNILVGMASLVGKYVREVMMERIVRHYRADDPELPSASGYHDPVTRRFVVSTQALRRKRQVPDHCFERVSLGPPTKRSASPPKGRAATRSGAASNDGSTKRSRR